MLPFGFGWTDEGQDVETEQGVNGALRKLWCAPAAQRSCKRLTMLTLSTSSLLPPCPKLKAQGAGSRSALVRRP